MSKFFEKYFKVKKLKNDKFSIEPVWKKIEKIPEFAVLKTCKQNPKWHSEGDAMRHTKLVVENAIKFVELYRTGVNEYTECLIIGALFHDIGKGVTTFEKNGVYHAYGHEVEGEKITRKLLWDEGYEFREKICALVRYHMEPLNWFSKSKNFFEGIIEYSNIMNGIGLDLEYLLLLKKFDIEGSKQENEEGKQLDLKKISELIRLCNTMNLDRLKIDSVYNYFLNREWEKENKKEINVFTLIGLPGAGKDTFLTHFIQTDSPFTYINDKNYHIICTLRPETTEVFCRDDIRAELGFCKPNEKIVGTTKQEEEVSKVFNKRLLDAARNCKNIVINNINLKAKYREEMLRYLSEFKVNSYYIYIEADSIEKNIERRDGQVSADVFERMIMNFDWPKPNEYKVFYKITT